MSKITEKTMYMKFINPWIENRFIKYVFMVFWRIFIFFMYFLVLSISRSISMCRIGGEFGFSDNEQNILVYIENTLVLITREMLERKMWKNFFT